MKILVPVKRVIDPYVPVRLDAASGEVVDANVPHALNPFDEVSLTRAVQLKAEGAVDEVIAISIGPDKAQDTLRTALAIGADRAVLLQTDQAETPFTVALALQRWCEEEQPDLVLLGKQAIDDDAGQTPPLLAGLMGWPLLPDIFHLEIEPGRVRVRYDLVDSEIDATASLPCILCCELHLAEPHPVGLAQTMRAKRKPLTVRSLTELGIKAPALPVREKLTVPTNRPPCRMFPDVEQLVAQLRNDGRLN